MQNFLLSSEQDMQALGAHVMCRMEIGHTQMIIGAVEAGLGISLLPEFTLTSALQQGKIVKIPLKNYEINMAAQIIYDKNHWITSAMKAFLDKMNCYTSRICLDHGFKME